MEDKWENRGSNPTGRKMKIYMAREENCTPNKWNGDPNNKGMFWSLSSLVWHTILSYKLPIPSNKFLNFLNIPMQVFEQVNTIGSMIYKLSSLNSVMPKFAWFVYVLSIFRLLLMAIDLFFLQDGEPRWGKHTTGHYILFILLLEDYKSPTPVWCKLSAWDWHWVYL